MIGSFFERIALLVAAAGFLAWSLGLPEVAFLVLIGAVLLSPN